MNILYEIWSSLSRNRFRTAMTGFAVFWGIFMMIVMLGASSGLEHGIMNQVTGQVSNRVQIWAGWTSKPYKGLSTDRYLHFSDREVELLRSIPEVENVSPVLQTSAVVNIGEHYTTVELNGVPACYGLLDNTKIERGRFINTLDEHERRKICVVDQTTVTELGGEDLIGRTVLISGVNFLVVGVCSSESYSRTGQAYIPLQTQIAVFSPQMHYRTIMFSVSDSYYAQHQPEDLKKKLYHIFSPVMQFDETDTQAMFINNSREDNAEIRKVLNAIRLFVLIVGWLMLVSGAVGVSNIMLVSVRERTKEFGIRKAIGAPPRTILFTVLGESLLITLIFGLIGVAVGGGIILLLDLYVPQSDFFDRPTLDVPMILTALFTLIAVGCIAGLTPALRALRIKPIEALNYDK